LENDLHHEASNFTMKILKNLPNTFQQLRVIDQEQKNSIKEAIETCSKIEHQKADLILQIGSDAIKILTNVKIVYHFFQFLIFISPIFLKFQSVILKSNFEMTNVEQELNGDKFINQEIALNNHISFCKNTVQQYTNIRIEQLFFEKIKKMANEGKN